MILTTSSGQCHVTQHSLSW